MSHNHSRARGLVWIPAARSGREGVAGGLRPAREALSRLQCLATFLSGGGSLMKLRLSLLSTALVMGAVGVYFVFAAGSAVGTQSPLVESNVLAKALNVELGQATRQQWEQLPSSGVM